MANETSAKDVDAFLARKPEPFRSTLQKMRAVIRAAAPKAEEYISYAMPSFKQDGGLVCYDSFKEHCSLFPMSTEALKVFAEELKGYSVAKGTIRFAPDKPLPAGLVKKIVKFRIAENAALRAAAKERAAAKKAVGKKPAKKK